MQSEAARRWPAALAALSGSTMVGFMPLLARRLYADLFEHAVRAGHDRVVCEVNKTPPNPASDAFHAALGFVEVGTASVYGSRTVRYLSQTL